MYSQCSCQELYASTDGYRMAKTPQPPKKENKTKNSMRSQNPALYANADRVTMSLVMPQNCSTKTPKLAQMLCQCQTNLHSNKTCPLCFRLFLCFLSFYPSLSSFFSSFFSFFFFFFFFSGFFSFFFP
ncbi:hypothetical protein ASPWEDRAFT_453551 [Aspergillus wentii DTO 134E9]|uniref:Uncharacterized protein n=1 Tax=Aspergillus wentii DTO 134E9 TaxID=1073089 RepID=A0A1L9RRG7_ASPWE|nr:uncharacterized protein ASPWEDRAFT_453551 [Aspergillus wentii DTO 134E9]OJJ37438.1 hypothetical protein ASPWEDRAFT_453551 [Aspergillus wentii DTO 134E9]